MIVPADLLTKMAAIFPDAAEEIYVLEYDNLAIKYSVDKRLGKNDLRATVTFISPKGAKIEIFLAYEYFRVSVDDVYYEQKTNHPNFQRTEELQEPLRAVIEEALKKLIRWVEIQPQSESQIFTPPTKEDLLKRI
jgi:hypothetical protein